MEKITINYQTYKESCECCGHDLEKELSEYREFDIEINNIFEWAEWHSKSNIYEEEVERTVFEYLYNTIKFYALNGNEELHLIVEEVKKVETMVRDKIKTM